MTRFADAIFFLAKYATWTLTSHSRSANVLVISLSRVCRRFSTKQSWVLTSAY